MHESKDILGQKKFPHQKKIIIIVPCKVLGTSEKNAVKQECLQKILTVNFY